MTPITRTCNLALLLALGTASAQAANSDVGTDRIDQTQSGELNVIDTQVGRVQDKRSRAGVTARDIEQAQEGDQNIMQLHIGNAAEGGRSEVGASRIKQTQRATGGLQQMAIGNAAGRGASAAVTATGLRQEQRGSATQSMVIGDARDGGRAEVRAGTIEQIQEADSISIQALDSGSARLGSTSIVLRDLTQHQKGSGLIQSASIGTASHSAGSRADVTVSNVRQLQFGRDLAQTLSVGNALTGGKTRVTASHISQTQSGESNTLSLAIGDAADVVVVLPPAR